VNVTPAKLKANRRNLRKARRLQKKKRRWKTCEQCGLPFSHAPCFTKKKYCSWTCRKVAMKGSRASNWKGGVDRSTRKESFKTAQWRNLVIALGRCRICGGTENLEAHHIMSWKHFPELRFDVNNGECLCSDCHDRIHTKARNRKIVGTPIQQAYPFLASIAEVEKEKGFQES
jgi:hypothetical protein